MEATATLRFARTSPRKVRLVADLIRSKDVGRALNILHFTNKTAARTIEKLLKSAISNAEENSKVDDVDSLVINKITVDEGPTWKRFMPRARGSSSTIFKRTSHITISLKEIEEQAGKPKKRTNKMEKK